MENLLQDYTQAAANMSEEQKAAIIKKVLKQKEKLFEKLGRSQTPKH
jgi:hypothetical protein